LSDKCGFRRGCSRDATLVQATTAEKWDQLDPQAKGRLAVEALNCNVHGGMFRRRKYMDNRLIPIDDPLALPVVEAARAYRQRMEDAEQRIAAERQAEAAERFKGRIEREWAEVDREYRVVRHDDEMMTRTIRGFEVRPTDDKGERFHDHWRVELSDSEEELPVHIEMRRSGGLTPNRARALGEALVKAAELAVEENAARKLAREVRR
jgi:hypothetical protein